MFVLTFFLLRVRPGGGGGGGCRRRRRSYHRLCPRSRRRRGRRFLMVLYLHRPRLELHLERRPTSNFALQSEFCDDFSYHANVNSTIASIPWTFQLMCGGFNLLRWSQKISRRFTRESTMRCETMPPSPVARFHYSTPPRLRR